MSAEQPGPRKPVGENGIFSPELAALLDGTLSHGEQHQSIAATLFDLQKQIGDLRRATSKGALQAMVDEAIRAGISDVQKVTDDATTALGVLMAVADELDIALRERLNDAVRERLDALLVNAAIKRPG